MSGIKSHLKQVRLKIKAAFKGWRGSVKLFSIMAWLLAVPNLIASIKSTRKAPDGSLTDSIEVMSGVCKDVNQVKLWTQLGISAASIALLAATNFAMQAWAALTREEIDQVHRDGETADIGIPSLRNMLRIAPWRRVLWAIMFTLATTLHLIYSGALYSTTSASDYTVFVLTEQEFGRAFTFPSDPNPQIVTPVNSSLFSQSEGHHRKWQNISIPALLQRYGTGFASNYRSAILVARKPSNHDDREGQELDTLKPGVLYQGVMQTWSTTGIPQTRWVCDLFDLSAVDRHRDQLDPGYYYDLDKHKMPPANAACRVASIANKTRSVWTADLSQLTVTSEVNYTWPGRRRENNSHDGFNHLEPTDDGEQVVLQPWALSETIEPHCRLLVCPLFWWLATASNVVIATVLTWMSFFYNSARAIPLVTIGDVIDSYLSVPSPDFPRFGSSFSSSPGNINIGPVHHDFHAFKNIYYNLSSVETQGFGPSSRRKRRLMHSVGGMRWWLTLVWWLTVLVVVAAGFSQAWRAEKDFADNSMADIFARGFGSSFIGRTSMILPQVLHVHTDNPNSNNHNDTQASSPPPPPPSTTTAATAAKLVPLLILSNMPQLGMSLTYLLYNSLLTIMVVELEWHSFSTCTVGTKTSPSPQPLRVSQPRGSQQNTFFLSLPYKYGIPLLLLSAILQWLVGQSLFLAVLDLFNSDGQQQQQHQQEQEQVILVTLGYSLLSLFWLLLIGMIAWLPVILLGYFRKLPQPELNDDDNDGGIPIQMPLLGSCSAVVAASCRFHAVSDSEGRLLVLGIPQQQQQEGSDDDEEMDINDRRAASAAGKLRWGVVTVSNSGDNPSGSDSTGIGNDGGRTYEGGTHARLMVGFLPAD